MRDQYNRSITYARFSITDRCNLRCQYCMPAEGVPEKQTHAEILAYEDFLRIARLMVDLGIRDFKVTGGEPLVRKGAVGFIKDLKDLEGVRKVTLTTNGVLLADYAKDLFNARVDGINISLDSLNRDRYAQLTRRDRYCEVMSGIRSLNDLGFHGIKINMVPIKGINEQDIIGVAEMAEFQSIHVRFIELMPIGLGQEYVGMSSEEVLELLEKEFGPATPYGSRLGQGPATYVSFEGFQGKIGFIGALHDKFCDSCNRVRVTSQGVLKGCLQYQGGLNIADHLGESDDVLRALIEEAIYRKPQSHAFEAGTDLAGREPLGMDQLGG